MFFFLSSRSLCLSTLLFTLGLSISLSRLRERKKRRFSLSSRILIALAPRSSPLLAQQLPAQTALRSTPWSPRPSRGRSRRCRRRFLWYLRRLLRRRRRILSRRCPWSRSPAALLQSAPSPRSRRVRARPRRPRRRRRERAAACLEEEAGGPRPRGRSLKLRRGRLLPLSLPVSDRRLSRRPLRLRRTLRPTSTTQDAALSPVSAFGVGERKANP